MKIAISFLILLLISKITIGQPIDLVSDRNTDSPSTLINENETNTSSNSTLAIIYVSGTLTGNTVWTSNNLYVVQNSVTIPLGSTLTIEPGTIIKFEISNYAGLLVVGTLIADGTSTEKIVFTSIRDDAHGGDTNGDGNATTPAAGDWNRIYIENNTNSVIDNCKIMYGSRNDGYTIMLYNSSPTITNSQMSNNYSTIYCTNGSSPLIQNNVIDGIGDLAIATYGSGAPVIDNNIISNVSRGILISEGIGTKVTNNSFNNISTFPIELGNGSCLTNRITGNTYTNCGKYGISLSNGLIQVNGTFLNHDLPYVANYLVTVQVGSTLIIEPGTIIKFEISNYAGLLVVGTLIADGTSTEKIVFTSIRDDAHGGDTNGDGNATTPAAGDWNRIYIENNTNSVIDNCKIMYGSRNDGYTIMLYNSSPTITNSQMSNNYSTIYCTNGSSPLIQNNVIDGIGDLAIATYGSGAPVIDNNIISNVSRGILISEGIGTKVTNNSFNNISTFPIELGNGSCLTNRITGNTYTNCGKYGISLSNGLIQVNGTFLNHDLPYVANYLVTVQVGSTLIIEPGTIIKFEISNYAGLLVVGTLIADGTSTEKIVFTSIRDDAHGGDTNGDGNATTPAAGDWNRIYIENNTNSVIDNCKIMYGSRNDGYTIMLYNSSPTITNSQMSNNYSTIYCTNGSSPLIQNNVIDGIGDLAIATYGSGAPVIDNNIISNVSRGILISEGIGTKVTNNSFNNISTFPIELGNGSCLTNRITGNTYTNCGKYGISLSNGLIQVNGTFLNHDLPYVANYLVTVQVGSTLIIEPGTIIKFEISNYAGLLVVGTLIADGTSTEKIVFTSIRDDAHGGDTNGDGNATTPAAGDWNRIYIENNTNSVIDNCKIMYGSRNDGYTIMLYNSSPTITNSQMSNNYSTIYCTNGSSPLIQNNVIDGGSTGINVSDSNPLVLNNSIINQTSYGFYNSTSSIIISALQNWWGHSSGPLDNSDDRATGGWYNPNGLGSRVSDYVNYQDWLGQSPIFTVENEIYGKVTNLQNQPIENAQVTLTGNNINITKVTNLYGNYNFNDLPPGNYNLSVNATGFNSSNRNVNLISGAYKVDFSLVPIGGDYFSINENLRLYANEFTTLEPNFIKASGNVNINGILYFSSEVIVDKRINNYYPVVYGNGTLIAHNIQGQDYSILTGDFKYQARNNQLVPVNKSYLMDAAWLYYVFFKTKIGIITFDLNDDYIITDFIFADLGFPMQVIIEKIIEDSPVLYPAKLAGGKTYSHNLGVGTSVDITIRHYVNFGAFSIDTLEIYQNEILQTLGCKIKVSIPGDPIKGNILNDFSDDLKDLDVEVHDDKGEKLFSTNFNNFLEFIEKTDSKFLGFKLEVEFVGGKPHKFIVGLSTKIPLGATGLFITEMTGGVDDLYTKEWKIIANVDIETGLELPIVGPPIKLDDFGVLIAPLSYFEGGGTYQIFRQPVANGFIKHDLKKSALSVTGELNLVDIILGNVFASVRAGNFSGGGKVTLKFPNEMGGLLQFLENQIIGSVQLDINNFTMQAQTQYKRFYVTLKVIFNNDLSNILDIYVGANLFPLIQIWKGSKDADQIFTFQVPENTPQLLVSAGNDINLFDFVLESPSGVIFDSLNTDYYKFNHTLQTVMLVDKPEEGDWQLFTPQTGTIIVETVGINQAPTVLLKEPGIKGTRSNMINLKSNDYSDTLEVEVFYDTDNKNFDGVFIKKFTVLNNVDLNFEWLDDDIQNGEYFIYCRIDDGQNAPVLQYAPGSIVVQNSTFNEIPQNFTVIQEGDSVKAEWQFPPSSTSIRTVVYYKNITNARVNQAVAVDTSKLYLKELEIGQEYKFWASFIDPENNPGPTSNTQNLVFTSSSENNPPYFTINSDSSWIFIEDESRIFNLTANDADGQGITFNVSENPPGMTVNGNQLSWTPTYNDRGTYNIILTATDGFDTDSIYQEVIVYTLDQTDIEIDFNSPKLYEDDNMFIKLNNYKSPNQIETVTLKNKTTSEQVQVNCRRVNDFEFIGEVDLSFNRNSMISVSNGDTILVTYNTERAQYTSYGIYDSLAQATDIVPPGAIADLQILDAGLNSIELRWTATGDDGNLGEALKYDIRYAYSPILTEDDYLIANLYDIYPYPSASGETDSLVINLSDLIGSENYDTVYFSIKAEDEMQNRGVLGNSAYYNYLIMPSSVLASVEDIYNVRVDWSNVESEEWGINSEAVIDLDYYKVHRKLNNNEYVTAKDSTTELFIVDTLYFQPDGDYEYGIQAVYDGIESDTVFSNQVTLNRFVDVRILCTITDSTNYEGINLLLEGLDTIYAQSFVRTTNQTGLVILDNVFKSSYSLLITKVGLPEIIDTIAITDTTNEFVYTIGITTFQLIVNVSNGWNMVSVPGLNTPDQNVNSWWQYTDQGANVFRYAGGYQSVTDAVPGTGYWMKHSGARTYNTGDEWPAGGIQIVSHDPLVGAAGWNLIGGYEIVATVANVTTNPPGLQSGPIYAYSGGYQVATTLNPGYGYWIKLNAAGQIIIPETLAKDGKPVEYFAEDWGRITLTDATGISYTLYAVKGQVDLSLYDLPPAPPAGMFDIRYSSGRIAEDINSSIKAIDMSGVTYPLTVRVEGMDIRIMDESGKMINTNLKSGEDVVISDVTIQKLMVSGEMLPTVYSLEQNYPNPFNPSTVIEFSLPEDVTNVKLSIYNVLGEKVTELVNTSLKAGKYQYQWNASGVATGMYIYELRTEKFVAVKKMVLIR